ncbi:MULTISPECIES: oxalurate catabolism protein HpxZ [unclassified Bradyrhizobium]|uniref:oxalurate catabolism protein HpxZ n=1 Tax=unclassified Bradyrhizobium TaxID=2631580 RepID=UPI0028ED2F9A|nr:MULTISPECIES: oxalurate catabolism protein HpxZ [unclassified Bradyrhizobium]
MITRTSVDIPEVFQDVCRAVDAYEIALTSNDLPRLADLFAANEHVIRYGPQENLHGAGEIAAFRAARPSGPRRRTVVGRFVTTYGQDLGVAHVEFRLPGRPTLGRQTQTWVRLEDGWKIVSAHVSYLEEPPAVSQENREATGSGRADGPHRTAREE